MKNNIFNKCVRSFTARFLSLLIVIVMIAFSITSLCACGNIGLPVNRGGDTDIGGDSDKPTGGNAYNPGDEVTVPTDDNVKGIETDDKKRDVIFVSEEDGKYVYEYADGDEVKQAAAEWVE